MYIQILNAYTQTREKAHHLKSSNDVSSFRIERFNNFRNNAMTILG